jgi:hypothetical protein
MSDHITHNMEEEREVVFSHSPDPAYLAVVDAASYQFFAAPDLDYDGMLAHLGKHMAMRTCVAWGCPEKKLTIRFAFTRDHTVLESVTQYASGFQRWVRSAGRLYFSSHADLYHCATNNDWTVFSFPRAKSPHDFLSRELVVPAGIYSVIVFRHFGWFESDQDAPLLGDGTHYTIILRHYPDESHLGRLSPPSSVPWT